MQLTIPAKTTATIEGIEVEFVKDTPIEVQAETIDHAAELGVDKLGIDLTHEEDGKKVYYISGKRHELLPEDVEEKPKKKPGKEVPVEEKGPKKGK